MTPLSPNKPESASFNKAIAGVAIIERNGPIPMILIANAVTAASKIPKLSLIKSKPDFSPVNKSITSKTKSTIPLTTDLNVSDCKKANNAITPAPFNKSPAPDLAFSPRLENPSLNLSPKPPTAFCRLRDLLMSSLLFILSKIF